MTGIFYSWDSVINYLNKLWSALTRTVFFFCFIWHSSLMGKIHELLVLMLFQTQKVFYIYNVNVYICVCVCVCVWLPFSVYFWPRCTWPWYILFLKKCAVWAGGGVQYTVMAHHTVRTQLRGSKFAVSSSPLKTALAQYSIKAAEASQCIQYLNSYFADQSEMGTIRWVKHCID